MDKSIKSLLASVLLALIIPGCASTNDFGKASSITLTEALRQVGAGLGEMKAAEVESFGKIPTLKDGNFVTGLFPTEVAVTFNIAASTSKSNALTVDLKGSAPGVPISGGVSGTHSASTSLSRGNQITLKFSSALFATTTTTVSTNGTKVITEQKVIDGKALQEFLDAVRRNKVVEMVQ